MQIRTSIGLASIAMFIALLGGIGWISGIEILKTAVPHFPSMRFNTALCIYLLGMALIFMHQRPPKPLLQRLAMLLATYSLLLAGATLIQYICQVELGIDQLFIQDTDPPQLGLLPGRMAPITAVILTLTATCFLLRIRHHQKAWLWQGIALVNVVCSALIAMSYLYGAGIILRLHLVAGVSLPTTVALVLLNLSVLLSEPVVGLMAALRRPYASRGLKRRGFPLLSFFGLVLLGFIPRIISSYGLLDHGADALLVLTIGSVLIFGWLIWQRDVRQNLLEDEATSLAHNLKLLIDHGPGAVAMLDKEIRYIWASQRWISDYRLDPKTIIGRSHYDFFPEIPEGWRMVHQRCLAGSIERRNEELFTRPDGTQFWIRWEVRPWYGKGHEIGGIVIFSEDITDRKEAEASLIRLNQELSDKVRERTKDLELQSTVVRNMAEGVCLIRATDGRIVYANPKFEAMFGYQAGELEGLHVSTLNFDESSRRAYDRSLEIIGNIQEFGAYSYEICNKRKDATPFWCRATTSAMEHPHFGSILVAVHEDITTRKQQEEELKRSEKRYRDVVELASDGIFETDSTGTYVDVNPAGCAMLGYAKEEIVGHSALDLVADADRERLLKDFIEIRKRGETHFIAAFDLKRKDGSILPTEVSVKALPDGRRISFLRNMTFRKEAEAALSASEKKYRSLVEGAYDSILLVDAGGKIIFINEQLKRKFGYAESDLIGRSIEILLPARYRNRHILSRRNFARNLHSRPMGIGLDLYARRQDGSEFPVDISLSPMHTEAGFQITAIIRDITERKRHEDQQAFLSHMSKSLDEVFSYEERAQAVAEGLIAQLADQAIVRVFEEGRLLAKGAATRDIENHDFFLQAIHQGVGMQGRYGAFQAIRTRKPLVIEDAKALTADQASADPLLREITQRMGITSYVSLPLIAMDHVIGTLSVSMSISGRRFASADVTFLEIVANRCALAIENARLYREAQIARMVTDNMPALIAYWDRDQRCRFANHAYNDWFNFTAEDMLGRTMEDVLGRPLYQQNAPFIQAALAGKPQRFEHDLILGKTGELKHTQSVYLPEIGGGAVQGFFVLETDVTELKQAQVTAEAAVRMREEVLGFVSHDLRNPLAAIDMAAQILTAVEPTKAIVASHVKRIKNSVKAMQNLIADLLDFGKIQEGAFTVACVPTDVTTTLNEAMDAMHAHAIAKKIQLLEAVPANLPPMFADRRRVVQVIWNLLGNAIKFTPEKGRVTFAVTAEDQAIRFSITDTGPGIRSEDLPNIFDRFWQTEKTAALGSGLGLAIAKGIVKAHGGAISAVSEPGQGSTFSFTIPASKSYAMRPDKSGPIEDELNASTLLHDIHVLIVDDAAENLTLLRFFLEKAGARVSAARSMQEALQKIAADRPDVVITDIEMPDGSGYELVENLQHAVGREPGLPVAALTGYTSEREVKRIADAGFDACLAKPISPQKLIDSVRDLAHRAPQGHGEARP